MQHLHVSSVGMLMSVDVLSVGSDMNRHCQEEMLTWEDVDMRRC